MYRLSTEAISPSHISGSVSWSVSSCVRRSMPASAIKKHVSTIAPNPCQPNPHCHTHATTSSIVSSSTSGYCGEIGARHERHLPRSASQLNTGTFSNQLSWCPQCGQCERSTTRSEEHTSELPSLMHIS